MRGLLYATDQQYVSFYRSFIREIRPDAQFVFCRKASEASQIILKERVDLILADLKIITRKGMDTSGLHFLNGVRNVRGYYLVPVVLVADVDDEGPFLKEDVHCYEFFRKPLNQEAFREKIGPLLRYADEGRISPDIRALHFFRKRKCLYPVSEEELVRFELHSHNGLIVTLQDSYDVDIASLRKDEELLSSLAFLQVSRCDYVNKKYIQKIEQDKIVLKNDMGEVFLTDTGRENVKRFREDLKRNGEDEKEEGKG